MIAPRIWCRIDGRAYAFRLHAQLAEVWVRAMVRLGAVEFWRE